MKQVITGNYFNKYESKNPIVKHMVKIFKKDLDKLIKKIKVETILDIGCGEGYLANFIKRNNDVKIIGIDIGADVIAKAKKRYKDIDFFVGDVYNLRFKDNSFDCVVANEVLEHLDEPRRGLKEIIRVSKRHVILSVPNEPFWRMANVLRLKYLSRLGNTPGHVQHWTKEGFKSFLRRYFSKVEVKSSALWNFALCEK